MDHLRAMRLFLRIADLGTLTAASTDLGYARGAASATLAELESYLGVQLVERTTRRLRITEDGLLYLDRARRILAEIEDMEAEIGSAERAVRGTLRVQLPAGIARLIAPDLPDFMAEHPGLSLEILSRNELPDFVGQGLDAAVYVGEVPDLDLVARPIGRLPMLTVATPEYLARHGTPRRVEDLKNHQCIGFRSSRSGEQMAWRFRVNGQEVSFVPVSRLTFEAADAARAAIFGHGGLMQIGSYIVYRQIRNGTLVSVLDDCRAAGGMAHLLHPRHRHKPRKLKVFEDFLLRQNRDFRRRWNIRDD